MSQDKKINSFKVLMENAPVGSLFEVQNYIRVFYKFENDADTNKDPIMSYHQKYYSLAQDNNKYYFITNDNMLQHVEGFKYEFFEVDYDLQNKTKTPVIITVDISTCKIISKEEIKQEELGDIYKSLSSQYIDSFQLYEHLNQKFNQEGFQKHFLIKEKSPALILFYTIKNFKKKNFEKSELNCKVVYDIAGRQLIITFSFHGFLQGERGQKFSHKKVFREIKTLKDTQTFLNHLNEIENIYIDILKQALISQNSILHNVRLEKPIIQSSFNWDVFGNYKIQLMDEIHKQGFDNDQDQN